ncbi:MAG: hypothetical protein HC912_03665 [Saprospiraceae bacterium]|nr:hypothetical protein [Saprospiraceae bacterium]
MIKKEFLLIIILLTTSCSKEPKSEKTKREKNKAEIFIYRNYNVELMDEMTINLSYDTFLLKQDEYLYRYINKDGEVLYDFDKKVLIQDKSTIELLLKSSMSFSINGKSYAVHKYVTGYNDIDGCVTHFFSPDFGIIFQYSTTWGNYRELYQSPNDELVSALISCMYNERDFYKGCLNE